MKLLYQLTQIALAALLFSPFNVWAADTEIIIRIKDHRFIPEQVNVPAGERVKLLIKNEDATPEEFESHSLNREKVVQGNSQATIYIGPLKAGTYPFLGSTTKKPHRA